MRRIFIAFGAALMVMVGSTASASAAGAQVRHLTLHPAQQCSSSGSLVLCSTIAGEETLVTTPSGNESGEANLRATAVISNNGVVEVTSTAVGHEHFLYKDGTLQEDGGHLDQIVTTSTGQTCRFSVDIHITNGTDIQYDRQSFTCS